MRCLGIGAGDAKGVWRTRVPTRETMCCQTKSMCHVAIVITRWAASVVGADAVGVVLVLLLVLMAAVALQWVRAVVIVDGACVVAVAVVVAVVSGWC